MVSVFQLVFIVVFNCVPLYAVLKGVFVCDHWCRSCHHPWWCNFRWHPPWWYFDWHPRRCNGCHFPGYQYSLVFSCCTVLNNFDNLLMGCNWLSPIVKVVCGPQCFITCISSLAALVACPVSDNPDMMRCCGKIPPNMHIFPPYCWVCSMCSISSAP